MDRLGIERGGGGVELFKSLELVSQCHTFALSRFSLILHLLLRTNGTPREAWINWEGSSGDHSPVHQLYWDG